MPNHIETVRAMDGKLEDKIVFGGITAILLIAASLMYSLYPPVDNDFTAIPKSIRATLTSLSNAGEELALLTELEGDLPPLSTLQEMQIPPFADNQLDNMIQFDWVQNAQCFIGQALVNRQVYQVKLKLGSDEQGTASQVFWQKLPQSTPLKRLHENCLDTVKNWQTGARLSHAHKGHHDH